MVKIFLVLALGIGLGAQFCIPLPVAAKTLAETLSGRILLLADQHGEAWYIYPKNLRRYYLADGPTAYELMRTKSLGIKNVDLAKIPIQAGDKKDVRLVERLKGHILLAVESHGEAWYVNPVDGLRYYLKDGAAAYQLMRTMGLGITTDNLRTIPMNDDQVAFDYTFDQVAHVRYEAGQYSRGYYADRVLPVASLTKLMTALVVLDLRPDWTKKVTVTEADVMYPRQFVGEGDITSEVDLQAGDTVTVQDLWGAMLLASSNQAAGILARSLGVLPAEFVSRMNEKAKLLGLNKTVFTDPSGLDTANLTTVKDMAVLAQRAFAIDMIARATVTEFVIAATTVTGAPRSISVANRNYSLMQFGADAAKTGFLYEAQRNVALKKGNAIVVVFHARSMNERNTLVQKLLATE